MEQDDDLFLVIIESENGEDAKFPLPIMIKQEPKTEIDYTESNLPVEDIIETVEKHGQFVEIKIEPDFNEYEYLEDDPTFEEERDNAEFLASDEKYILEKDKNNRKKEHSRKKMLKPEEQKSFVADLREQYPELKRNQELLIHTLCEIMRSVKPPEPPTDYYKTDAPDYICTLCGAATESQPAAARHYQEYHGPRYLMCYACGVDFRSKTNLYKHEKRCNAPDAKVVLKARAITIGSKARSRPYLHLRKTALTPPTVVPFECAMCRVKFNTKCNLRAHEFLHLGERPYQCHVCPAAYTSKSALSRHIHAHSDAQYICDDCGRSFKYKAALVVHMDTHRPLRKFGCSVCGRRFAQKAAMKLHLDRVHRNLPPPCACQICPKRFPRMSVLKVHMKQEHGLTIMTRKMFFKKLPMLSASEIKTAAKLIFKNKVKCELNENEPFYMNYADEIIENEETQIIVPDLIPSQNFLAYANKKGGDSKMYAFEDGDVKCKITHPMDY